MEKEIIFQTEKLSKHFIETIAVDQASMTFYKGEVRGLIGENGSGKSTVTSMIAGINKPTSGAMLYKDAPYMPQDQIEANRAGVAILVQEMNTLPGLSVAENIFLGQEKQFEKNGFLNKRKMNQAAGALLEQYKMGGIDPAADITALSFEDRKIIEIIKAMNISPEIFIIDETTTALSQKGRDMLYEIMDRLRERGGTIIFISHDLQEVIEKCDTISVLRDGKVVGEVDNDNTLTEDSLKRMMVGRELEHKYYREDYGKEISGEVVLEAQDINLAGGLQDVSFQLHKGEILGIGGLTSSGMHELGKILYGAVKPDSGEVTCQGKRIANISHALKEGMAYISKNRDQESLMLLASIRENICLPSLDRLKDTGGVIKQKRENGFAENYADKLDVKRSGIDQYVFFLSGGNKQKVALATWISFNPRVMILDCPTRGIDVKVKAAIYRLMEELTEEGISIIMISEELLELLGMCDRIIILNSGRITAEFDRTPDLSEEAVIQYII